GRCAMAGWESGGGQAGGGGPGGGAAGGKVGGCIVGAGDAWGTAARPDRALRRAPALAARLFAEGERGAPPASLAACFAAKEAVAKALGGPPRPRWAGVGVVREPAGRAGRAGWGCGGGAPRRPGAHPVP